SDKGKTTERWRRKVSGLKGASPRTAGPPESSPMLGLPRSPFAITSHHGGTRVFMSSWRTSSVKASGGWIAILLSVLALWMLPASRAHAEDCVADLGGLLDGFVTPVAPSNINIDGNCTIRNFPASNPLSTNFSFFTQPGQTDERWLIIFDNVVHTGQMLCDAVHENKI